MLNSIEDFFTYNSPKTQKRVQRHNQINSKALELAKLIDQEVRHEDSKKMALVGVQFARMMANQGITVDEINDTLFSSEHKTKLAED